MSTPILYRDPKGILEKETVRMELIHGNKVVEVYKKDKGRVLKGVDGLITKEKGIFLVLPTADCLPIALFNPTTSSIGLVHAGWRGLTNGIIGNTAHLMGKDLIVYIGPHICKKHYEIKGDVSAKFGGVRFLDLAKTAKEQLIKLGVKSKNITIDAACTFENKNLFSFRRDKTKMRNRYLFILPS